MSALPRTVMTSILVSLGAIPATAEARAFAQQPPASPAATPAAQEAKPTAAKKPAVYDESADAPAQIEAALARAKKENRRVLIQWGANWCGWCVALHETMTKNGDVANKLRYEYDVVRVDMGKFDKNVELSKKLGAEIKAIPYLTILDADGKPVVNSPTEPFELTDGKTAHDPKKLIEYLTQYQAPYRKAEQLRGDALARAGSEKKRVLLHFGAPWCGWCHRFEGWMERPEVAPLLAKEFVDLKIDTDRTIGGAEFFAAAWQAAGAGQAPGIPWIALLGADGTTLATSQAPKGNIGCPNSDEEIAHFISMLEKARVNLTPADLETLRASLVAMREEGEKQRADRAAQQ